MIPLLLAAVLAGPTANAPNFSLYGLKGGQVELDSFGSKPVLIHFWATWCVPCLREFPELIVYAKKHPEFTILAIDFQDERSVVKKFLAVVSARAGSEPSFPILMDNYGVTASGYHIDAFPTTLIVRDGVILNRVTGVLRWNEPGVHEELLKLMNAPSPDPGRPQ